MVNDVIEQTPFMLPSVWHRYLFLFGLISLAGGMLFGAVPTSVPQFILLGNWLLEKNYHQKWQQLKSNHIFWILASLFILHIFGMTYTQNMQKGLDELRIKLPLLILPLVLFSSPTITDKELKFTLRVFFFGVLLSSIYCYLVYAGFTKKTIIDIRQASVFMSHIRYSICIAFAIMGLLYFTIKASKPIIKLIKLVVVAWLLYFMIQLQMATGLICLALVGCFLSIVYVMKHCSRVILFTFFTGIALCVFVIVKKSMTSLAVFESNPNSSKNLPLKTTRNGRYYKHDTSFEIAENGNLILINICDEELNNEWNKRSTIDYNGADKKGNALRYTLWRYLASKGYLKDSVGVNLLTNEDIIKIEKGQTNYQFDINSGLVSKWRELIWGYKLYKSGANPSGQSLNMRLEFWKTGWNIVKLHPWFGVGTGDIQDSYNQMYTVLNSNLDVVWRLRSHNQYLAITVAFGVFGLVIFLVYLLYPAFTLKNDVHELYWPFFFMFLLSFLTEDTLETQAGVTSFIFFQTLFLWMANHRAKISGHYKTT